MPSHAEVLDAILKDAYISEKMLDSYYEQREMHRKTMLATMAAAERCPDDPVVQFMQATSAGQADIIDRTIENLEEGLAKRPEGGWLAALERGED